MSKAAKSRHKDFGSPGLREEPQEPPTFDLYGETFEAYPEVPGAVLLKFVREADSGDTGRAATALLKFFELVLVPESFKRFEELWEDPKRVVTVETLGDIVGFLVEEYTENPTKQPAK